MEITTKLEGAVMIVLMAGKLDMATTVQVTEFFARQFQDGHVKLVADFSQLAYLSSAGLRVLLTAVKEARARGGDLRLAAIQPGEVEKVLRVSGFTNVFKVYPDPPAAAASFAA